MKQSMKMAGTHAIVALALSGGAAIAQVSQQTLQSLSTPDKLETRIGTLEFKNGAPSAKTAPSRFAEGSS